MLVEDALTAVAIVRQLAPAEAVDVGSRRRQPAASRSRSRWTIPVTLLEATRTKCRFLERAVPAVGARCTVVHARSEEYARGAGRDRFPLALARALAPPPVAAELVLPLVAPGGAAILWTGARVDHGALAATAEIVAGTVEAVHEVAPTRRLVVLRKAGPTPERFPRRPGIARARPLVPVPSSSA